MTDRTEGLNLPDIWNAVRQDDLPRVQQILADHPQMLNMQEPETLLTPLHIAAVRRNWNVSLFLLSQEGIDGSREDTHGRPVMAMVYSTRDQEFIDLFRRRLLPADMAPAPASPVPSSE